MVIVFSCFNAQQCRALNSLAMEVLIGVFLLVDV